MRVLELYSGIGGMHYALQESGVEGEVVASIDINTIANEVYRHNFPKTRNLNRIIESLSIEEVKKLNVDTILMSPPCQPFTRLGLKKDVSDKRTCSLLHVLELIPRMEGLKQVLVENVKGFECSEARDKLVGCLRDSGFNYKELILSPCQFGVPNTRHRYYLIAKKKGLGFCFDDDSALIERLPKEIMNNLPETMHTKFMGEQDTTIDANERKCYRIQCILDECIQENDYLIPDRILEKHARVLDVQTSRSNRSCCFTKAYGRYMEGTGSVFCPLSPEMLAEKCTELKQYENDREKRLESLRGLRLRYFTSREIARLMCFPESFEFPGNTTTKQRYRLLGNSINVHVVSRLIILMKQGSIKKS